MWLRERRGPVAAVVGADEDRAEVSATDLHPYWVTGDRGAQFAVGQRVPQCQWRYWPYDEKDGAAVVWLLAPESRSWAKLTHLTPDANDDESRYASTALGGCGMRSKPRTPGGCSAANPAPTAGSSRSPRKVNGSSWTALSARSSPQSLLDQTSAARRACPFSRYHWQIRSARSVAAAVQYSEKAR